MDIKFDASDLDRAMARMGATAEALARAQYRAINAAAAKGLTASRRAIQSQVALPASYLNDPERLKLVKATASRAVAVITARRRGTTLFRFSGKQVTVRAKGAKGDALRGIKAGRKAAGVSVQVKPGGPRKTMPDAFLLPLRSGKDAGGNGMGIFTRSRSTGQLRHRYGPSVDQVFRQVRSLVTPGIEADLREQLIRQIKYELSR